MLNEFDQNTIANMTAALDHVCRRIPPIGIVMSCASVLRTSCFAAQSLESVR